jgi:flagellar hook-associated protein 1
MAAKYGLPLEIDCGDEMGLASALASAMAGSRGNQAALSIVSSNTATAQPPGSITRSPPPVETVGGGVAAAIQTVDVNRQLDLFIQNQLRTEVSDAGYADQMAYILTQLKKVYGGAVDDEALETTFDNFAKELQSLSSDPGSQSARIRTRSAARSLAAGLNKATKGIQALRSQVDQDVGDSAAKANIDLGQVADINTRLQELIPTDPRSAQLIDQRDGAINDLAKLVDVRVVTDTANQVSLFTKSGVQLVNQGLPSAFVYSSQGPLGATSLYNSDPARSGVGSLGIELPGGASIDAVANNAVSSGQIAADLKLRDQTLVQAQTQVDQLAATLASSLSDQTAPGTVITGPLAGFAVDTSNILPGNRVNLTYTDSANTQHQVSIVNLTDPPVVPLQSDTKVQLVGVNFSLGMASVVSQLNAALGSRGLQFSNSGSTLNLQGSAIATVNSASITTTTTTLTSGHPQLPLFTDGNALYTGAITANGSQMTGLAGRIAVNPALSADPSKLSVSAAAPGKPAGDSARPSFLLSQLTSAIFNYSPRTGLGSPAQPSKGTLKNYLQQFVGQQTNASTLATQLQQGQNVVISTLQQKSKSVAGVSLDTEMTNLIQVQNAYAANSHIMSVVQNVMQTLLQAA